MELGISGLSVPRIIFGSSAFGNLYREQPFQRKREIAAEWVKNVDPPAVIDSAGKYGAGLALESIGAVLRDLAIPEKDVCISNKLGWYRVPLRGPEPGFEPGVWKGIGHDAEQRIGYRGILECWEQGCELLGNYRPEIISVHDPDEYLAAAGNPSRRSKRFDDVLEAYRALFELKETGKAKAVGVGAKDWRVIEEITRHFRLDWVMLACSMTVYRHPPALLDFMSLLQQRKTAIINSAVFNAGFLIGGDYFDYRKADPVEDANLFDWRRRFFSVCGRYGIKPAAACVEFGLSVPGTAAVALNTGNPDHVADNVRMTMARAPAEFWKTMKNEELIRADFPYLG